MFGMNTATGIRNALTALGVGAHVGTKLIGGGPSKGVSTKKTFRTGGSRTTTEEKKKKEHWAKDSGGMDYIHHTVRYKKSKIFGIHNKLSNPGKWSVLFTGAANSDYGRQWATTVKFFANTEVKELFQALNKNINPLAGQVANKFALTMARQEIEVSNPSPTAVEVDVYWALNKDSSLTGATAINEWSQGLISEQGPAAAGGSITYPWGKPTDAKRYNLQFWTHRMTRTIPSGGKIKVTVTHMINRIIDFEYFDKNQSIRGITSQTFIVQRGVTVDDQNIWDVIVPPNVTLSRTKVTWVGKLTLSGQLLSSFPKVNQQTGNFFTGPIVGMFEQEGDGDVVNVNVAAEFA